MKKTAYYLHILAALCLTGLFGSCQDSLLDDGAAADRGGVEFRISLPVDEEEWITRAPDEDETPETLRSLRYLLADADGNVLDHHYGRLSEQLDCLYLDGLTPGGYSIVLLGASEESAFADIKEPSVLSSAWLSNVADSAPVEGTYFFKKVDFEVGLTPEPIRETIVLDRPMTKVQLEIPGLSDALENLISSVRVTFDGTPLYSTLMADGSYTGQAAVQDYEMRDSLFNVTFHTLPAHEPVSGTVTIRTATLLGDSLTTSYRFENLRFEAGKEAKISVKYQHPDNNTGFILVRPRDYYDYDADLMMMEDEPLSVLHNSAHRRYQVCKPLTVTTWEDNMRVRLFMAAPVDDVDIYANFPSLGLDSIKIAHFDRVEPFLDMLVPMPFLERDCHYYDINGRRVTIPKLSGIPANIEWVYKTPDAYLKQLSEVKYQRWHGWCPSYETYWARYARTPGIDLLRHGCMISQCMAIMFDSEEFYSAIEANTGTYVNNDVYLTNEDILNRVNNFAGFGWGSCNPASGALGWGGGSTMIFMAAFYRGPMYPGTNLNTPVTSARNTLFHEYGHCMGFSHSGNMTYGGKWVGICCNAYLQCFKAGMMPYGTPDYVFAVPYAREDAPKWAKPRFVIKDEPEPDPDPEEVPDGPDGEERPASGYTGIAEPIA